MPQELTLAALRMAITNRQPDPGLMHHSDRGSQYAGSIGRRHGGKRVGAVHGQVRALNSLRETADLDRDSLVGGHAGSSLP